VSWLVRGLLVLMAVVSVHTLRHQRRLKVLRNRLVEQMDAATKHRARAERFYEMSILDPLTGLYNRRFGETRLREEIARAEKSGDPLQVLALDFDRFKEINDQYGHAGGDLALKAFARRLQRAIRACDVPIRVGGDEFLVILPECPPDKVQTILSRLNSIEVNLDGQKVRVSFSRGVAQYQINDTPETIIKRADERLYAEKAKRPFVNV
jgi:two-component system cell cycle response regulator